MNLALHKKIIDGLYKVSVLLMNLLIFAFAASAQEVMNTNGEVHTIAAVLENYQDFIVPQNNSLQELNLEVEGADGGWIEYNYYDRFRSTRTQRVNGGQGATISATFEIGPGAGQIPPGAHLRFIVGNRAEREKIDVVPAEGIGAGGGGGTGVLLSKDRGTTWHIILVAGGGGGGAIKMEEDDIKSSQGLPGVTEQTNTSHTYTRQVKASGNTGDGGEFPLLTGGGGGAFTDGKFENGRLYYGNAGWKNRNFGEQPLGGLGGTHRESRDGGWGFGGGGSGNKGGGGGGGYSGGGAGLPGYGGSGGSSYVETMVARALNVSKQQNGDTDNPGDGHVRYQFVVAN